MKNLNVTTLNWTSRLQHISRHAMHTRPSLIVFALALFFSGIYFICTDVTLLSKDLLKQWQEEPATTLFQGTMLLAAVSIWIFQLVQEWKSELPKYLSVDFRYLDKQRIRCKFAQVVGESDVRGMAQSLGQAVNHGERLPIAPTLDEILTEEMQDTSGNINKGQPFLHYSVVIRLTQNVTKLGIKPQAPTDNDKSSATKSRQQSKKAKVQNSDSSNHSESDRLDDIPQDQYVCWTWPFTTLTKKNLMDYDG